MVDRSNMVNIQKKQYCEIIHLVDKDGQFSVKSSNNTLIHHSFSQGWATKHSPVQNIQKFGGLRGNYLTVVGPCQVRINIYPQIVYKQFPLDSSPIDGIVNWTGTRLLVIFKASYFPEFNCACQATVQKYICRMTQILLQYTTIRYL